MADDTGVSEELDTINETSSEVKNLLDVNEGKTFLKGYCLYKHMRNRRTTSPNVEDNEKTVKALLNEELPLNKNFSLSLIKTDLKAEQEARLQEFLIKRLSRSTMYNISGSLATLSSENISEKPVTCYYKLIKGPSLSRDKENICSMDFLVCFVVSETSNLYLFQQELERFCKSYELKLSSLVQETELDAFEIFKDLGSWYEINVCIIGGFRNPLVLYVCRCTKLFQLDLSSLISMGLLGETISVLCLDQQCKEDVLRFIDVCSLSNLLSTPTMKESNHKLLEDLVKMPEVALKKVTISGSDYSFDFSSKEGICEVCNDWAKTMVGGEQDNPVFLRQVMENYKLKVIQDMNSLKRLLREAETDHYALFKAYVFLTKCPSSRIVMEHIRQEARTSMTKDICDVIDILDDFITEKGGFAKIYSRKENGLQKR